MEKKIFIVLIHTMLSIPVLGQTIKYDSLFTKVEDFTNHLLYKNFDTAYIESFTDELNLKLLGINKLIFFQGSDKNKDLGVRYRPDRQLNLGLGIAYKWFSLDMAFNVGIREKSGIENSQFLDFQGNTFSSKHFISASLQYYYGYQLTEFTENGATDHTSIPREDVRTILFGLQYLFASNHDKFSFKAPFVLNELQKKSAGSMIFGTSFKMYTMDADSALAPPDAVGLNEFPINDLNNLRVGINFGYMYSFVWRKHFFLTLGLITEVGLNMGDYETQFRAQYNNHISLGFKSMNAIGYNGNRFFTGFQFLGETFNIRIDDQYRIGVGNGKAKAFIGYRFKNKSGK